MAASDLTRRVWKPRVEFKLMHFLAKYGARGFGPPSGHVGHVRQRRGPYAHRRRGTVWPSDHDGGRSELVTDERSCGPMGGLPPRVEQGLKQDSLLETQVKGFARRTWPIHALWHTVDPAYQYALSTQPPSIAGCRYVSFRIQIGRADLTGTEPGLQSASTHFQRNLTTYDSTDGTSWVRQAEHAPWGPRTPRSIVYKDIAKTIR